MSTDTTSLKLRNCSRAQYTRCFKKCGVERFAITSSTVNRFWKFFYCWKRQWIIWKMNTIFLQPLKNLAVLPCET